MTVIETSTGEKLTGEDAPKKSELKDWLEQHPGYVHVHVDVMLLVTCSRILCMLLS